jgi:hypothetical protein
MRAKNELKIFRKMSIDYLERMYRKSVTYILDKNTWRSTELDTYGESRILLHTRKSLKKLGNEMNIFKYPMIVGLSIIYDKSMALFDKSLSEQHISLVAEENYLLRDLSASAAYLNENELKIFKLSTVDILESSYNNQKM